MTDTTARPGPPRAVATPCVKVCIVDPVSSLCLGCFRTLPEIGGWSRFSDEERARLMTELPGRRGQIRPEKLAIFASASPPRP
ncbi:MAG: DUF1289 domain-containing protein [Caulobacter sp.]|nr:DUF1289 domain-containing protein [Caulobacter sp.]